MNDLGAYAGTFDSIKPWRGRVPAGFVIDFVGTLIAKEFVEMWGCDPKFKDGAEIEMERPALGGNENGEFWFEATNWVMAAREARERFVMVTLGALYGYQVVGCARVLQLLNPMPYKLVAVEPIPKNVEWTRRHMADNGINPDEQWIVQSAISDSNEPAFFPVGAPGSGAQNCISTNERHARLHYIEQLASAGAAKKALTNLILHNTTGLNKTLIPGMNFTGEIRFISCVTLKDILGPLDRVDYLESDIQESEILVFPPHIDLLKRKVRRIHIGTHGAKVHATLHKLFADHGWEIVFSYAPESTHPSPSGPFKTNDGILTVRNPNL